MQPSATEFNFISHDNAQINFREFLQNFAEEYLKINKRIIAIPMLLEKYDQYNLVLENEMRLLAIEIDETRFLLNNPFQPD